MAVLGVVVHGLSDTYLMQIHSYTLAAFPFFFFFLLFFPPFSIFPPTLPFPHETKHYKVLQSLPQTCLLYLNF